MNFLKSALISNRELAAALAAISFGCGFGFLCVGVVYAAQDRDAEGLRMWEAGTTALLVGCGSTVCAAKGETLYRRAWVRRYR